MATFPRSRVPSSPQVSTPSGESLVSRNICLVVGLTCLAGFAVDMLAIATPPDPFALEWRINILQQIGDRSIILLFGVALLLFSVFSNRRLARPLSLISMAIGVALMLSCVLIIRDSLILRNQTITNIGNQAEQLQTQIDESRNSPELPADITPEQIREASAQIANQADSLKTNAREGIVKASFASIGNLIVVGLGLAGLGRLGLKGKRY